MDSPLVDESDQIDQNFDTLFNYKLEEYKHTDISGTNVTVFARREREAETGRVSYLLASDTTQTQVTVAYNIKYSHILGIQLTPIGTSFTTRISSFTGSSMVIQLDATAAMGTASRYNFFYRVTGTLR